MRSSRLILRRLHFVHPSFSHSFVKISSSCSHLSSSSPSSVISSSGMPLWMSSYEQLHELLSNGRTFQFSSQIPSLASTISTPLNDKDNRNNGNKRDADDNDISLEVSKSGSKTKTDRYQSSVSLLFFGRSLSSSSTDLVPHVLLLKKQIRGRHGGQISLPGTILPYSLALRC
jgi:hypothetical protein